MMETTGLEIELAVNLREDSFQDGMNRVWSCSLWNVDEAFAQPGRCGPRSRRRPIAEPICGSRAVGTANAGYGEPDKTFAVGLGCDIRHTSRLIYSRGLDLADPSRETPIGAGRKVRERANCSQRAFQPIGRAVAVDQSGSTLAPYPMAWHDPPFSRRTDWKVAGAQGVVRRRSDGCEKSYHLGFSAAPLAMKTKNIATRAAKASGCGRRDSVNSGVTARTSS